MIRRTGYRCQCGCGLKYWSITGDEVRDDLTAECYYMILSPDAEGVPVVHSVSSGHLGIVSIGDGRMSLVEWKAPLSLTLRLVDVLLGHGLPGFN